MAADATGRDDVDHSRYSGASGYPESLGAYVTGHAANDGEVMVGVTQRKVLGFAVVLDAALVALVAVRGADVGVAGSALIQGASVAVSVYGGVVFAREGNSAAVTAAAVKSVRRVLANYNSLGRLALVVQRLRGDLELRSRNGQLELQLVDLSLIQLSDLIEDQIASADIAIRDWEDLAPGEVATELKKYEKKEGGDA